MATWSPKSALQGSISISSDGDDHSSDGDSTLTSCCLSPSLSPSSPLPTTTTTTTTSPTHDEWWDDSGFQDWEMQLGVTGEMTVVERLQYLLDTGQFADINIRVGQGNNATLFKAHKLLLATASQPLYRLVQQSLPSPATSDVYTLRITDVKPADFENILKYIYTDKVECENINVAFGLLRASRKWGLAGLGIKSLTYLEEFVDNFTPETEEAKNNLFDLLVLSEDTLMELSGKCYDIILRHAETLIPCPGYLSLDKAMVEKVLCHPKLKIQDQLKLFEAIRDWGLSYLAQNNLPISSLGSAVEEIIKVVDFEKISDSDFLSTVLTSECLGKAEVIAFFMTHGLEIPRKLDFNNNKEIPFWLTFCATSSRKVPSRGLTRTSNSAKRSSVPSSSSSSSSSCASSCTSPSSLAPVNEGLTSICSLTQNGSVMEFNKVCRFKKGYRCSANEIYMQHELRFRVDKNVKLLGVGFGFLFTPTDMGLNIHCQGPWETRQWTDIIQSYVRVSGEKQETADVRLMFLHPVRIEANQSYKVVVKMVRMSHGSNEVELWGGSGGVHSVETEDAEFFFIKAAVDPEKSVEESDGDTSSGVITALLYKLDTDEPEPPASSADRRRRRPVEVEDEVTTKTNPWRHRTRNDSLKIPETPTARKRSPAIDQEAPPTIRRRERPPPEEYKPTSFSTNRWGMRPKDEEKKPSSDEYVPSTFSTNRWARPRPKDETGDDRKKTTDDYLPSSFSTNRWARPRKEESETKADERKTSAQEEYKPSSFATNRWAKPKEDKSETTIRKTSAPEEYRPSSFSTNRWARRDDKAEAERKISAPEEYKPSSFSTNRWAGKSEKTDTERKTSTEEYKPSSFSTNRWARKDEIMKPTLNAPADTTRTQDGVNETPYGMRLRPKRQEEVPSTHPFARRRESSATTSDVPFYLRKNDDCAKPPTSAFGRSRFGSLTSSPSTPSAPSASTSTTSKPAESSFHSRFLRSSASSSSPYSSSRFGSVRESSLTRSSLPRFGGSSVSRYDSPSSPSTTTTTSSTSRKPLRYGNSATSSGSNLLALSTSRFGLSSNPSTSPRRDVPTSKGAETRYGSSSNSRLDRFASPSRYGGSGSGSGSGSNKYTTTTTPGSSGSSSRYNLTSSSVPYTTTSRYGGPGTDGARYSSGSMLGRYSGGGTAGASGYTSSMIGQGRRFGYGK